jgi:hypothetical protein
VLQPSCLLNTYAHVLLLLLLLLLLRVPPPSCQALPTAPTPRFWQLMTHHGNPMRGPTRPFCALFSSLETWAQGQVRGVMMSIRLGEPNAWSNATILCNLSVRWQPGLGFRCVMHHAANVQTVKCNPMRGPTPPFFAYQYVGNLGPGSGG